MPTRFVECGLTQEKSVGWIEPRGVAHSPLVESVGGQWMLKLCGLRGASPERWGLLLMERRC